MKISDLITSRRLESWEPMNEEERQFAVEYFANLFTRATKQIIPKFFQAQRSVVTRVFLSAFVVGDRSIRPTGEEAFGHPLLQCGHIHFRAEHGTGKTRLAEVVAYLLGGSEARYELIEGNDLRRARDFLGQSVIHRDADGGDRYGVQYGALLRNNIVFGDEMQRAPVGVCAAILGAMTQESLPLTLPAFDEQTPAGEAHRRTQSVKRFNLLNPFWVLFADNPLEYIGVNELGKAENDRFTMELHMEPLTELDLIEVGRMDRRLDSVEVSPLCTMDEWLFFRRFFFFESSYPLATEVDAVRLCMLISPPPIILPESREDKRLQERIKERATDPEFRDAWRRFYSSEEIPIPGAHHVGAESQDDDMELYKLHDVVDYNTQARPYLHCIRAAAVMAGARKRCVVHPADVRTIFPDVVRHRIFLTQAVQRITKRSFWREKAIVGFVSERILKRFPAEV